MAEYIVPVFVWTCGVLTGWMARSFYPTHWRFWRRMAQRLRRRQARYRRYERWANGERVE